MTEREKLAIEITNSIFDEHCKKGCWSYSDIEQAVLDVLPEQFDIVSLCNPLPTLFKELVDELDPFDEPHYVPSILKEAIKTIKKHTILLRLLQDFNNILENR